MEETGLEALKNVEAEWDERLRRCGFLKSIAPIGSILLYQEIC